MMKEGENRDVWRGVLIKEGLEDTSVLKYVKILRTDTEQLEGEGERGTFHFHKIEIDDTALPMVRKLATESLKNGWYFHLVKGDTMLVIFRGRTFEATRGHQDQFDKIKQYGYSVGVRPEQIVLERLMDNPYDE